MYLSYLRHVHHFSVLGWEPEPRLSVLSLRVLDKHLHEYVSTARRDPTILRAYRQHVRGVTSVAVKVSARAEDTRGRLEEEEEVVVTGPDAVGDEAVVTSIIVLSADFT